MEFFVEIINEEEFAQLADKAAVNILSIASYYLQSTDGAGGKRFYVALVKESIELEDFLDDHGARNNKVWVYFGELVASVRNIASTAYMIRHILSRIKFYKITDNPHAKVFITEANKRLDYLNDTIRALFSHLIEESAALGLTVPQSAAYEEPFEQSIVTKILPQDINDEGVADIHENISRVAAELIDAYNDSSLVLFEKKVPASGLNSDLIPGKINEETLRHLEAHVHNAQSMYDTYIQKTPIVSEHQVLATLRGYISITLHLLGVAKSLCHFFERHETSVRNETTRKKIARIVNRNKILDTIVNFALLHYTRFITDGVTLAREILDTFTVVDAVTVSPPEGLGFHLRPSTLVAKVANHYGSPLAMVVHDNEFDASSVIDIMWAGGMIKKEGVTAIEFRGDRNAVRDLKVLAEANYGEDTQGNSTPLPDELAYLRQE